MEKDAPVINEADLSHLAGKIVAATINVGCITASGIKINPDILLEIISYFEKKLQRIKD
jgi:hypothetical protein